MSQAADYGTAFTLDRKGRPVPTRAGIELADIADIDRPDKLVTVRVARQVDPLLAILKPNARSNPIGFQQHASAERMRRDSAISEGASGWSEDLGTRITGGGGGIGPTGAMIDAQGRVRAAWLAIRGQENDAQVADVVRCVVLGWATLEEVVNLRRCRHGTARGLLIVGLARLVEHHDAADGMKGY